MNIFDAYLKLIKVPTKKSAFDVALKRGNYEIFDIITKYYLLDDNADYIHSNRLRKPKYKLVANKGVNHLSGIYMPNDKNWGYGDVKTSTRDLLIFNLSEDLNQLEVFLSKGRSHEWNLILNMILDNELNEELINWRK